MKKSTSGKIAIYAILAFNIIALIFVGNNFLQAQEGQNQVPSAKAAEADESKLAWYQDYFSNYLTWPSSATPIQPDHIRYWLNLTGQTDQSNTASQYTDVNGDGLVDIAYRYEGREYALLLNNGDNKMTPTYLCYVHSYSGPSGYVYTFYGNCVSESWTWAP